MTFAADLTEAYTPEAPRAADPRIARAEAWLCMLSLLSDIGMWLVRALIRQVAPGMDDPMWTGPRITFPDRCNPITVFVRLARAVRLAVALRMKIAREIADLRAGKALSPVLPAPQAMLHKAPPTDLAGDEAVEAVGEVEKVEDLAAPPECERPAVPLREAPKPFRESDRFYRLLNGPLKDAVAAICADLGLRPDWSLWTEDGFPPPPGGDVKVWDIFRAAETETPPPQEVDGAAHIIWRPSWRQPRRRKSKAPPDPRYDRGPDTWPDFNDYYYNEVLPGREANRL